MAGSQFVVLVRGADELRVYRLSGEAALEAWRMREAGALERPGGTKRLLELLGSREPDGVVGQSEPLEVVPDFDLVADDELSRWMSRRVMQRRARESD